MEPPIRPRDNDCCGSGCAPCIFDAYEAQLAKYNQRSQNCTNSPAAEAKTTQIPLSQTSYSSFRFMSRHRVGQEAYLMTFELVSPPNSSPQTFSNYQPGQHLLMRARDSEGQFTRAYTPINVKVRDDMFEFTVVVRLYSKGRMSRVFRLIEKLQGVQWRGPYGNLQLIYTSLSTWRHVVLVAQGTGVAPLYCICRELVQSDECKSFVKLLFCVRSDDDILLHDHLHELARSWNFTYEVFAPVESTQLAKYYNEVIHRAKLSRGNLEERVQGLSGQVGVVVCGSDNFTCTIAKYCTRINLQDTLLKL